jgi:hypothetical protein
MLDALGARWALDLGADNYNLPGYFGGQRWTYYRMRAEGHNTMVINPDAGPDQDPAAETRIIRFHSQPKLAFAIADLTPAYAKQARQASRGIALLDRQQVLVQDEVRAEKPAVVWWFLHTPAQVNVNDDGKSAMLVQGDKRLLAQLLAPKTAKLEVMDAAPLPSSPNPANQARNQGIRKLAVRLSEVTEVRLAVLLTPLVEGQLPAARLPEVQPLAQWN